MQSVCFACFQTEGTRFRLPEVALHGPHAWQWRNLLRVADGSGT